MPKKLRKAKRAKVQKKIKFKPGSIVIYYSKKGKVVSDMALDEWYQGIRLAVSDAVRNKRTLVIRVGTENMLMRLVLMGVDGDAPVRKMRFVYKKRVFGIDAHGNFVGNKVPRDGKFMTTTSYIQDRMRQYGDHNTPYTFTEYKTPPQSIFKKYYEQSVAPPKKKKKKPQIGHTSPFSSSWSNWTQAIEELHSDE